MGSRHSPNAISGRAPEGAAGPAGPPTRGNSELIVGVVSAASTARSAKRRGPPYPRPDMGAEGTEQFLIRLDGPGGGVRTGATRCRARASLAVEVRTMESALGAFCQAVSARCGRRRWIGIDARVVGLSRLASPEAGEQRRSASARAWAPAGRRIRWYGRLVVARADGIANGLDGRGFISARWRSFSGRGERYRPLVS